MRDPKDTPSGPPRPAAKAETLPLRPPRPPIGVPLLEDGRYALPEGNPCAGCDHCCRYMTIQIPTPRSKLDFDNIRWYILHQNVSVYVDWEGDWMVQFDTPCAWLVDGRCTHYALRPEVCRDYDPADCERYNRDPAEKILLRTEADLERYLAERAARSAARRARKKKAARGARAAGARAATVRGKRAAGATRAAKAKRA